MWIILIILREWRIAIFNNPPVECWKNSFYVVLFYHLKGSYGISTWRNLHFYTQPSQIKTQEAEGQQMRSNIMMLPAYSIILFIIIISLRCSLTDEIPNLTSGGDIFKSSHLKCSLPVRVLTGKKSESLATQLEFSDSHWKPLQAWKQQQLQDKCCSSGSFLRTKQQNLIKRRALLMSTLIFIKLQWLWMLCFVYPQ